MSSQKKTARLISDLQRQLFENEGKGWFRIISGSMRPLIEVHDRILAEYVDFVRMDSFLKYFSESDREDIIEYLFKNSHYSSSTVVVHNMPDEGDTPFLEIAITEEVPLITGNIKHYPKQLRKGCIVLSPSQFLKKYFQ